MKSFLEVVRLVQYAQARMAVAYHLWELERVRTGLAKAYTAHDRAQAALRVHDAPMRNSEAPTFLLKRNKGRRACA